MSGGNVEAATARPTESRLGFLLLIVGAAVGVAVCVNLLAGLVLAGGIVLSAGALLASDRVWLAIFVASLFLAESVPFGPVRNFRVVDIVAMVLVARWIIRSATTRRHLTLPSLSFLGPLLVLLVANVLSVFGARDRALATVSVLQVAEFILLYLALADAFSKRWQLVGWFVGLFVTGVFVEVTYAIYQYFSGREISGYVLNRAEGTLAQSLGLYTGLAAVILFSSYLVMTKYRRKMFLFVGFVLLALSIPFTLARSALIWLVAALFMIVWRRSKRLLLVGAIFAGLMVMVGSLIPESYIEYLSQSSPGAQVLSRLLSLASLLRGNDLAYGNWTVVMRYNLWYEAWQMFLDHPLLGIGAKNYFLYIADYATPFVREWSWTLTGVLGSHSQYFTTLAEMGVLGIVGLLWLLVSTVREVTGLRRNSMSLPQKGRALAFMGVIGFFWLSAISGEFLFGHTGALFVAVLALMTAAKYSDQVRGLAKAGVELEDITRVER